MLYCKFTSRIPKGEKYGYFVTVLYKDVACTQEIAHSICKLQLMENVQYVNSIQSYGAALESIRNWQGKIRAMGEYNVILMTYNSTLAKWIEEPKKAGKYEKYLESINSLYRVGGVREIKLAIGLAYDSKNTASKYCSAIKIDKIKAAKEEEYKENKQRAFKSALDIINEGKIEGLDSREW